MSATLEDPMTSPFLICLVGRIRAEDQFGAWDRKSDTDLLKEYLMTKAERRLIPIIGDPDPETLDRVEKFYQAVGLTVERLTGIIATPMMKMSHEGFGRVVLMAALAAEGMKASQQAVAMIEAHPELARA
jgi:probable nitrogen fixation protein